MTTCPRCGRVADGEIVCANCGRSLALVLRNTPEAPPSLLDDFDAEEAGGSSARDVKLWRLGALVCLTCLVAATVAILLLNDDGGTHRTDLGLALGSDTNSAAGPSSTAARSSSASSAPRSLSPSATRSTATASRSASPSSSPTPSPTTSATSTATKSRATVRSVHLAKGPPDRQCGPHCYPLVVTLSGFSSTTHLVTCWSNHSGEFAKYTTPAVTSAGCTYSKPHDIVWVAVDGLESNHVPW
jgi:hypothetical protein